MSTINEKVLTKGIKDPKAGRELIENARRAMQGYHFTEMYNLESVKTIRRIVPDANLALVGGNRTFKAMEKVVNDGLAQMISMSRPFLNDPYIVHRFKVKTLDRSLCSNCGACVLDTSGGVFCHMKPPRHEKL